MELFAGLSEPENDVDPGAAQNQNRVRNPVHLFNQLPVLGQNPAALPAAQLAERYGRLDNGAHPAPPVVAAGLFHAIVPTSVKSTLHEA